MRYTAAYRPRSVRAQEWVETRLDEYGELLAKGVMLALLLFIVNYATTGTSTQESAQVDAFLASVDPVEIVLVLGVVLLGRVALTAIITLHELCHYAAYRIVGLDARFELEWSRVRGVPLYGLANGGRCWSRPMIKSFRLGYAQNAFVALAPLALSAACYGLVVGVHSLLGYEMITPLGWKIACLVLAGPSLPDWGDLLHTPRERWEFLVDAEDAIERHAQAEGFHR